MFASPSIFWKAEGTYPSMGKLSSKEGPSYTIGVRAEGEPAGNT